MGALHTKAAAEASGATSAGIRKLDRRDLTLLALDAGCTVAGVFTQNRFCAAPVQLCRRHLDSGSEIRALVINARIANAGTGEVGMRSAQQTCDAVGELLGVNADQVLPFSTGVTLESLPVDRLVAGLQQCQGDLKADHWHAAAHGIMTTDTVAKAASRRVEINGKTVTITGISKSAGMIKPSMAIMLGFVATDAGIAEPLLRQLVRDAADESFNCITVDGDTSTNDSFIVIATGKSGLTFSDTAQPGFDAPRQAIIRDGEGATKFITIAAEGGKGRDECKRVGYAIGHSPLVKTAFFASDPNLGRILDVDGVEVWLGSEGEQVLVAENGGRADSYREEDGARIMKSAEIGVRVDLGRGIASGRVYICDFSYDYVKFNADYRN